MQSWMRPAFERTGTVSLFKRVMTGAALMLALAAGLHSAPALAHAMLVKAGPPRRAPLTQPPAQVKPWFKEEVGKD